MTAQNRLGCEWRSFDGVVCLSDRALWLVLDEANSIHVCADHLIETLGERRVTVEKIQARVDQPRIIDRFMPQRRHLRVAKGNGS